MNESRITLAADVGGTKTLFELGAVDGTGYHELHAGHFLNADFSGLAEVAEAFLATVPRRPARVDAACFAVAGPVVDQRVRFTNLPWEIGAAELGQRVGIDRVEFLNDFAAIGHGIPGLRANELLSLQRGRRETHGVCGVLGAGTGLGMVVMVWTGSAYRVVPSEGGKADFAPINEVQDRLWHFLSHRMERVGCETLLSGRGIERIYAFLGETDTLRARTASTRAHESPISAAEITTRALAGTDSRAVSTVNLFLEIYGAVAGNLALTLLCNGGLYVGGGIAPRLATFFGEGTFMRAFCAKGKFADLMRTIPVDVIMAPEVGLRGAVALAARFGQGA